jgi:hypothetical protein
MRPFSGLGTDPSGVVTGEVSRDAPNLAIVTTTQPEARIVIFVDCPLCDGATPLDPDDQAMDCAACGVHLDLAPDDAPALAAAA